MARYQVPYTLFPIAAPRPLSQPAAPTPTGTTPRPIVPVRLDFGGKHWRVYSILDSGADHCMFPSFVIKMLGLDPQAASVSTFQGAGSVNQVSTFFDNVGVTIQGIPRFTGTVTFSAALDPWGFGLLGQNGFFGRFKVEFDLPGGYFYIEG